MMRPKVYLSGPISGLSYADATKWRQAACILLSPDIDVLDPMRGISEAEYHDAPCSPSAERAIFMRDYTDCLQADAILVNLVQPVDRVSIGTMMEIAWAYNLNIPAVLMAPGGKLKVPHDHLFIRRAVARTVSTLDTACSTLRDLLSYQIEMQKRVYDAISAQ